MKNQLNWYTYRDGPFGRTYWVQAETKHKAKTIFRKQYGLSLLTSEIKEEPN